MKKVQGKGGKQRTCSTTTDGSERFTAPGIDYNQTITVEEAMRLNSIRLRMANNVAPLRPVTKSGLSKKAAKKAARRQGNKS